MFLVVNESFLLWPDGREGVQWPEGANRTAWGAQVGGSWTCVMVLLTWFVILPGTCYCVILCIWQLEISNTQTSYLNGSNWPARQGMAAYLYLCPLTITTATQFNIGHRGPVQYNSLPDHIRNSTTHGQSKESLKKLLMDDISYMHLYCHWITANIIWEVQRSRNLVGPLRILWIGWLVWLLFLIPPILMCLFFVHFSHVEFNFKQKSFAVLSVRIW